MAKNYFIVALTFLLVGCAQQSPSLLNAEEGASSRLLAPAVFTQGEKEVFCEAVQEAHLLKGPANTREPGPDAPLGEFNAALHRVADAAAPSEEAAWRRFADMDAALVRMDKKAIEKAYEDSRDNYYDDLTATLWDECFLPLP